MNIFALDYCPQQAARFHCDKHVVKMILETAQMLCSVRSKLGFATPYKPTHASHPCTIWAGKSKQNYSWLVELGFELCSEYFYRYGRIHATQQILERVKEAPCNLTSSELTPFEQCMPDDYKQKNPVDAYKLFYSRDKISFCSYTRRAAPEWLVEGNEAYQLEFDAAKDRYTFKEKL